jgi:hypothetical protein
LNIPSEREPPAANIQYVPMVDPCQIVVAPAEQGSELPRFIIAASRHEKSLTHVVGTPGVLRAEDRERRARDPRARRGAGR